jgi:hypothetical protein
MNRCTFFVDLLKRRNPTLMQAFTIPLFDEFMRQVQV